ncbi:MAG TPA: metallophosphoesterase [Candidatus Glassbacteria bacterium]|jgi:DNA repair exonuclease SbcCD nuclease subunit|nr:metallophosphoesterase [Candidatus Glassbacteria bacterium]
MTKIAIVGDLHFGKHGNDEKYLNFQSKWFVEELIPTIEKERCSSLIFMGDVFDNRNSMNILVMNAVRTLFSKLVKKYKVFIIVGNHDTYYRDTNDVNSVSFLEDIGVKVFKDITELTIENRKFLFIPWVIPDNVSKLEILLAHNNYDCVCGHLEINGFKKNHGLIHDSGLSPSLFSNCEKVYSGHFHLRDIQGKINYIGTPCELDWGDYGEDKGFVLLDLETMNEQYVESTGIPRHVKLKSKDLSLDAITREMIHHNFIDFQFHEGITESDKIEYMQKIEAFKPLSFIHSDESSHKLSVKNEEELKTNLKDTLGALVEYMKLIDVPEGLDLNIALEKLKEVYDKSLD